MPFNILSTRKTIPLSSLYLRSEKIEWFKHAFHSHLLKYNHSLRTFLQCMSTELSNSPDRIRRVPVYGYLAFLELIISIIAVFNVVVVAHPWVEKIFISVYFALKPTTAYAIALKKQFPSRFISARFVCIRWYFFPYEFLPSLLKINRFSLLCFVMLSFFSTGTKVLVL